MDAKQFDEIMLLVKSGWTFWHGNTSNNEKATLIDRYMDGENLPLFPPGYTDGPVITEGKIKPKELTEEEDLEALSNRAW